MAKKQITIKTKYGEHRVILEKDEMGYMVTAPGLKGAVACSRFV
ncbi:MAG: hypothetical protein AAB642_03825 [Patescibacteria group bacterium]